MFDVFVIFFGVLAALIVFEFIKPRFEKSSTIKEFQFKTKVRQDAQIISPLEQEKKKALLKGIPEV